MTVRAVVWAVTIGLAAVVGGIFYCHPPAQPSDWASWASAIGTMAAVFVAVWATFAAEDRQQREAMRSARITSVTVASISSRLIEELERIEASLENIQVNGTGPATIALLVNRLKGLPAPSEEQLLRLTHAPGSMAVDVAAALGKISYAASQLSPAELEPLGIDSTSRTKEGASRTRPTVNSARTTLLQAIQDMVAFHSSLKGKS